MRQYLAISFCGFISGFALLIPSNTLNFWLSTMEVDIRLIGAFSLVSLPYAVNFLWAPIFDLVRIPLLSKLFGQRLSWIYILQVLLAITVCILSSFDPITSLWGMAICAFIVAAISSSQDTALGALRSEVVKPEQQGEVAGVYIVGYRMGMLLSSSGAIFASTYFDWHLIYKAFAGITLMFPVILSLLLPHNSTPSMENSRPNYKDYTIQTRLHDLFSTLSGQKLFVLVLIFLVLYRLPDNFIYAMVNPFLLSLKFEAVEIATVGKFLGIIAATLGGVMAGYIMRKVSITKSLLIFGAIHGLAHAFFILLNMAGHNLHMLFMVMGFESITSGMAMAAYIAFITSLCSGEYRATQYAFLSSMMGVSRAILPGLSGFIVNEYGWQAFYLFTSIATIPSLAILVIVQRAMKYDDR